MSKSLRLSLRTQAFLLRADAAGLIVFMGVTGVTWLFFRFHVKEEDAAELELAHAAGEGEAIEL